MKKKIIRQKNGRRVAFLYPNGWCGGVHTRRYGPLIYGKLFKLTKEQAVTWVCSGTYPTRNIISPVV